MSLTSTDLNTVPRVAAFPWPASFCSVLDPIVDESFNQSVMFSPRFFLDGQHLVQSPSGRRFPSSSFSVIGVVYPDFFLPGYSFYRTVFLRSLGKFPFSAAILFDSLIPFPVTAFPNFVLFWIRLVPRLNPYASLENLLPE